MGEKDIIIAVLLVLILAAAYYWYTKYGVSHMTMSPEERMQWERAERERDWEHVPSEARARHRAKHGTTESGDKYTGSASKYFPEANSYPTLNTKDITLAQGLPYEHNQLLGPGSFNPDHSSSAVDQIADSYAGDEEYNHQEFIEDDAVGETEKKNHQMWAEERRPYSGVARSPDEEFEQANYLDWRGLQRPRPVFQKQDQLFVTEVSADDLKGIRTVAFQG